MRKRSLLLCCALLLHLLTGCSRKEDAMRKPVNFYYMNREISYNTPDGVICAEIHEGAQFYTLEDLLLEYWDGPNSPDLQSLIPNEVSLLACDVVGETAYVYLSSQFSELTGIELTTVCSAILLTIHDFADVRTVCVRAENSKLDEKEEFLLSLDEIVLMDMVTSEEPKE